MFYLVKKLPMPTFGCFVPLPGGGEVRAALGAGERHGHGRRIRVEVEDPVDALLQPRQVDELRVGGIRDEMHFRGRRLRRRYLEKKREDIFRLKQTKLHTKILSFLIK